MLPAMESLATLFQSLADTTRLRLLILLQDGSEYCVCDLMAALDMPQSTVSRHLAYLKRNGWLQDRRAGIWMYYSLRKELGGLHRAQLMLVVSHLADSALCRADRERLDAYLRGKETNVCS